MERLKREKNPWEAFDEVRAFAREGRSSVLPEWASAYFKWWGIYTQGDGVGAVGGKGGEGKATEYFMMRIGMPNGMLTSEQIRVIADIAANARAGPGRHHRPPGHSTSLADHRVHSRDHRRPRPHRTLAQRSLRRCCAQCDRLPAGRFGCTTRSSTPRPCPDWPTHAGRQPGALQPAAQIQDLDHRLFRLVLLSRDQRHWPSPPCVRGR